MGKFIDFGLVKEAVPFADAIEYLDLRMKFAANQWRGNCPACGTTDGRSLVITQDKGFFCHAADLGGDVIGLARHILELASMRDAAFELADRAGLRNDTGTSKYRTRSVQVPESDGERISSRPRGGGTKKPPPQPGFNPAKYAEGLDYEHELLLEAGGDPEKLKSAGIGFSSRGIHRGRVVLRVISDDGEISFVGVDGTIHLPSTLKTNVVALKRA